MPIRKPKIATGANARQVGGKHYKSEYEHWDWVEDIGLGYMEANATRYIARWRSKDGLQALEKAKHYVQKLLELQSKGRKNRVYDGPRGTRLPSNVVGATQRFIEANNLTKTEGAIVMDLAIWSDRESLEDAARLVQGLIDGFMALSMMSNSNVDEVANR